MDSADVQAKARTLHNLLLRYAQQNENAAALLRALAPLLDAARTGSLKEDVDWGTIPGARTFQETDARELPGLEDAYAKFKIAITGGEPAWLQAFRERREH